MIWSSPPDSRRWCGRSWQGCTAWWSCPGRWRTSCRCWGWRRWRCGGGPSGCPRSGSRAAATPRQSPRSCRGGPASRGPQFLCWNHIETVTMSQYSAFTPTGTLISINIINCGSLPVSRTGWAGSRGGGGGRAWGLGPGSPSPWPAPTRGQRPAWSWGCRSRRSDPCSEIRNNSR